MKIGGFFLACAHFIQDGKMTRDLVIKRGLEGRGVMASVDKSNLRGTRRIHIRRWLAWIGVALVLLSALYGLSQFALLIWQDRLPDDAPRIAFSVDETWLVESGIMTSSYEQAFARAGGRLVWFEPADADGDPSRVAALLDERNIDGVLLSGGGDVDPALYGGDPDRATEVNRQRDDFEIALIKAAGTRGLPILGICRGCQILNVALGGTLRDLRGDEALEASHFSFSGHAVTLDADSTLADALGVTQLDDVYSFHGQAVDEPGPSARIVATAEDGVAEAIEVDADNGDTWVVAVQFHPEMAVTDEVQNRLFTAFVDRARAGRTTSRR